MKALFFQWVDFYLREDACIVIFISNCMPSSGTVFPHAWRFSVNRADALTEGGKTDIEGSSISH